MPALPPALADFLPQLPASLDAEAILRQWRALRPPYLSEQRCPPAPLWARRGLSDDGRAAWTALEESARHCDRRQAMCVYVHVPFCTRRCAFCDCYAFALRSHATSHTAGYVEMLSRETDAWSRLGPLAARPVSTVHLGGGTPATLGERGLERVAQALRQHLSMGPSTEWALESTTSALSNEMLSTLQSLGFTRLHLGVQSLQDDVRQRIGRREAASTVLAKIERSVACGWVVSVDVIVGLPGQTVAALLDDIAALEAAGVDGFSVYALQLSHRNRPFAQGLGHTGQRLLAAYLLFQAAAQALEPRGYAKTLFNHWAREKDTNLYFTFPERGEDCLALGAIADGILGDYHYRHPEYSPYCRALRSGGPWLQGGLRRTADESRLRPLEISLLSGRPDFRLFASILGADQAAELSACWEAAALIDRAPGGGYRLTANGSWFAGNMLAEALASGSAP